MRISLIVAIAENGVIGRGGSLPWRQSSDLKRFRGITMGKPVIMGRRTFQSLPGPLEGRDNIVVTRDLTFSPAGAMTAHSLEGAVSVAKECANIRGVDEIVVAGGAEVYRTALPMAERIYLTLVHASPEGDASMPEMLEILAGAGSDGSEWWEACREALPQGPRDDHPATLVILARRLPK